MRALLLLLLLPLAAFGPVTLAEAERNCAARFGTDLPLGIARMGYSNTGGLESSVEINLGVQGGAGGDPSAAYDACVYRQTGQLPQRPLFAR